MFRKRIRIRLRKIYRNYMENHYGNPPLDFKKIPIIINNFNQYDYLLRLIRSLESRGYTNIQILDNASTYPPLLEYYRTTPYKVHLLGKNLGYKAFWKSGLYKQFRRDYYALTDPDLEIIDECPDDFLEHFYNVLRRYPKSEKIGFSLKIDDLPEHYPGRDKVIDWEKQFWTTEVEPGVYLAPVDTTFALCRPYSVFTRDALDLLLRAGYPYVMRHLPWYSNPAQKTENEEFYIRACQTPTHWSSQHK